MQQTFKDVDMNSSLLCCMIMLHDHVPSAYTDLRLHQTSSGCFQATKSGSEACDMRFLYCACAISQMLNDWSGVDRVRASDYILSCLSYEGGFALTPGEEI